MYTMTEWLLPCQVRQHVFTNETGPSGLVPASIVGFGYQPGKPLEVHIGHGACRFYDVPQRMFGVHGGAQYALVDAHERPFFNHEPRPRRVTAIRLPWAASATGDCVGSLTWDKANVTLLVVTLDSGEIVFWPPHKTLFTEEKTPLPAWLKRRYADDRPTLALTKVFEASDAEVVVMTTLAKEALSTNEGWRGHGLGLLQKYMPGSKGPKQYRVHVWVPEAVSVGLESGIHDHRYNLRSVVVAGAITQEEWEANPNPFGVWRQWTHDNESKEPKESDIYFDLTPRTQDIRCGQGYTFPRYGFHRTLPRSELAITVMERFDVDGLSHALCPRGVTPINGQTVPLPIEDFLKVARKHMGIR